MFFFFCCDVCLGSRSKLGPQHFVFSLPVQSTWVVTLVTYLSAFQSHCIYRIITEPGKFIALLCTLRVLSEILFPDTELLTHIIWCQSKVEQTTNFVITKSFIFACHSYESSIHLKYEVLLHFSKWQQNLEMSSAAF